MSILNKNQELIIRYFERVWNQGHLDDLDEIIAADYTNHNPGIANPEPGPGGLKPIVTAIRTAFPDLNYVIHNMVVSETQVAVHTTMHGTHLGNLFGLAATGKKIAVPQMQIERIKNGKIVEHWRITDDLSFMKQLEQ